MKDQIKYIDLLRLREESFRYFTEEESIEAIEINGDELRFVKYQTPEICLEAVIDQGWALQHVINQTEDICLEAYWQDPSSIEYIRIDIKNDGLRKAKEDSYKYLTEEKSLEAVRENGYNLVYVKHQTEKICLEAVKQNGRALQYAINQTEEICLEAYKQYPDSIIYIRETLEEYRKGRLNLLQNIE